MCSIFGVLDIKSDPSQLRAQAIEMSKLLRHRGPDWSGVYSSDKAILVHERLAIVGVSSGAQPLYNPEKTHILANSLFFAFDNLANSLRFGKECDFALDPDDFSFGINSLHLLDENITALLCTLPTNKIDSDTSPLFNQSSQGKLPNP